MLFYDKLCESIDKIEPSVKYQHINNKFSLTENKFVDNYVSNMYYYHPDILNYFNNIIKIISNQSKNIYIHQWHSY